MRTGPVSYTHLLQAALEKKNQEAEPKKPEILLEPVIQDSRPAKKRMLGLLAFRDKNLPKDVLGTIMEADPVSYTHLDVYKRQPL